MQTVKARNLAGFLELEPEKQILFNELKRKVEKVFLKNGLTPMDTPILEYSDVLLAKAGGDTEKQIYRFSKGDTDMCMRFDLTVPFAKFCAIHQNELVFPFRRYQIGKVFRGERTQKGRLREFYQCDVDMITDSEPTIASDADCINILSQVYNEIKIPVVIKISNRKLLIGLFEELNLTEKSSEIMNILDKKNKMEEEKFVSELRTIICEENKLKTLILFMQTRNVNELSQFANTSEKFTEGIKEIQELFEILSYMNIQNKFVFDPSIIRGLDYYTGTVFETFFACLDEKSSIGGGGRYDNLASYYTDKKLSGVGFSVGLSRLFDLLDKNNLLEVKSKTTSVLNIIPLGNTLKQCFEISKAFRAYGISNEVLYFNKPFKAKLNYANKIGVPFMLVVGEDEVASQTYNLKEMNTGAIFEGDLKQIIEKIILWRKNENSRN